MEHFSNLVTTIDGAIWGVPMLVMIMGTGIYLTTRLGVLQLRKLGKALYYMVHNEKDAVGEVSSFEALCTALAATVGVGNIVGVATAVVVGGPGALFWMILAAFLGMATKYSEGLLAVKFRTVDETGHSLGGPFYYIEKGMGPRWKWLAKMFAFFGASAGLLGIGTITQVNSVASATKAYFDPESLHTVTLLGMEYSWTTVITAVIVAVLAALVIIGGIQRIAKVASLVVPFMIVAYVLVCTAILIANITEIPASFVIIMKSAFGMNAVAGGALGAMMIAMQKGVARGIFSNEAGLGSAPIAAAAAQTREPVRQGLVSMTGTFIDTIIICAMTGMCIMVTGSWNIGLEGVDVTINAFAEGLPWSYSTGAFVLTTCLIFFAFTTILGWDYYSERCLEYLTHGNQTALMVFRWSYILAVLIGPFLTLEFVWTFADIFNGLMAFPNLVALLTLSGVIVAETKSYFNRLNSGMIGDKQ